MIKKLLFTLMLLVLVPFLTNAQCVYTVSLDDTYGDGWNGNDLQVTYGSTIDTLTLANGYGTTVTFSVNTGDTINLNYLGGGLYNWEVSFTLYDANGLLVYNSGTDPLAGYHYGTTANCPSCLVPDSVTVMSVTIDSMIFNWTQSGTATMWQTQYDTANFTLGNGTVVTSSVTQDTLSGLSPNTTYEYYLRAICGPGDTSLWVGPFTFLTPCLTISSFPFTETFESTSTSITCWSNQYEVGTANWVIATGATGGSVTAAYSGTSNAQFVSQSGTNNPITKLVSPVFDLTSLSNPGVTFSYAQEVWAGDQNYTRLLYKDSPSASWVEIWGDSSSVGAWTTVTVLLPNASTNYQLAFEGINNYGYSNVIDEVIVWNAPLPLTVNDSLVNATCSYNMDGAIYTNVSGGVAPYTYAWSNGATTASITNLGIGSYTVTVTDSLGDTATAINAVGSFPEVAPNLGADTIVCFNDSLLLDVTGYSTYAWNNGNTTGSQFTNPAAGTHKYWVQVSDTNNCVGSDTINVTVNPLLTVDLGPDTSICLNGQYTMTPGTYSSYMWSSGSSSSSLTITLNNPGQASYSISVTDAYGCMASDQVVITALPPVAVDLGNDTIACFGESVSLSASGSFASYVWSTGQTTPNISVNTLAGASDTIILFVIDNNFCVGTDTVVVTGLAEVIVDLGNDTLLCEGESYLLDPGEFDYYLWHDGQTSPAIMVDCSNEGTVSVEVEDQNGCKGFDSVNITCSYINIDLGPDTLITDTNASVILDAGPQYSTYLWNDGTDQQTLIVTTANSGPIWVEVSNSDGCLASDTINVDFATSVSNLFAGELKLYPNPVINELIVELGRLQGSGLVTFKIVTTSGQMVHQSQKENGGRNVIHTINVSDLAAGMYFLEIAYQGQQEIRTIVVQ